MVQEFASAIWDSINSWFTPTVFFLLLNLMIATIALISTFNHRRMIARSPSSLLHRLKSINFYTCSNHESQFHKPTTDSSTLTDYFFQQDDDNNSHSQKMLDPQDDEIHQQKIDAQWDLERKDSEMVEEKDGLENENVEDDNEFQSMDEIYSKLKGVQFGRTKSDTEPGSGLIRDPNPGRMRKSASLKPGLIGRSEETKVVEARRPATVRERVLAKVTDGDEEVDAKADDFINKFKQQLKLQRLDSILGYKEKIRRGFGGR